MSLLDKIRMKSDADEAPYGVPEAADTTIDSRGSTGFDGTRPAADTTLAGVELPMPPSVEALAEPPAPAPASIISPAVPTEPGPNSEFPASSINFAHTTQMLDPSLPTEQPATGAERIMQLFTRHRQAVLTCLVALGIV